MMNTERLKRWRVEITIVWIALVALTLIGPSLAGKWILALAGIKFLLILASFMELRFAHAVWGLLFGFIGGVTLLALRVIL